MEGYCIALPKPIRKPIPSLKYFVIKHHGSTLLEGYLSCPRLLNIPAIPFIGYHKNTLGFVTYLLILGGVLHSFTKTYKQNNTLFGVFSKHHALSYPKNTLGSITYILKLGGVLHSPTKTYKQNNTLLGVFNKHHGLSCFNLDYQKGIAYG